MRLFKNKENGKTYMLEMLQSPLPFLDGPTRLGVYAYPYNHDGEIIYFKSTDFYGKCQEWIKANFNVIAEL